MVGRPKSAPRFWADFWAKVDKRGPDECWPWRGLLDRAGYGRVSFCGRQTGAHRVIFAQNGGDIPPSDVFACHRCDNPACVNPAHLFLGTARDNIRDMFAKGRAKSQSITHCPSGHEYSAANTYHFRNSRQCRACNLVAVRKSQLARRRLAK